ncbi:hypothetical protein Esti_002394 [Eimeria stiedai]
MAPWRLQTAKTKHLLDLCCGGCRYRMQTPQAFDLLFHQQTKLLLSELQKQQARPVAATAAAAAARSAEETLKPTEAQLSYAVSNQQHTASLHPRPSRAASALAAGEQQQQQQQQAGQVSAGLARRFSLLSLASPVSSLQRQTAVLRLALAGRPLVGTRRQRGVYAPPSPASRTAKALNSAGVACPQCGTRVGSSGSCSVLCTQQQQQELTQQQQQELTQQQQQQRKPDSQAAMGCAKPKMASV